MSTPFWDFDFAVAELERCVESGHKAMNFCNHPESHGEPPLSDPHWDRLWAAAQAAEVPITFHIGGGDITAPFAKDPHLSFDGEIPQGLFTHDHGQHRDARRPRLRWCMSSVPGATFCLSRVGHRLDTRSARDFRLAIPDNLGNGQGITVKKDKYSMELIPAGGDYSNSIVAENAIRYNNVFEDVDIQYTLVGNSIKEDIILLNPSDQNEFTFYLEISGLKAVLINEKVIIYDTNKADPVFVLEAPVMMDESGESSLDVGLNLRKRDDIKLS